MRCGAVRHGAVCWVVARLGSHGMDRHVDAGRGGSWLGRAMQSSLGGAGLGAARLGAAVEVRQGAVRHGEARRGEAWHGAARQSWRGAAR